MVKRIAAVKTADSKDDRAITLQPTESRELWGSHADGPWTALCSPAAILRDIRLLQVDLFCEDKTSLEGIHFVRKHF